MGGYVFAGAIGALVGASELAYRYRDNPWKSLWRVPGVLYVIVNGAASVGALYVIRELGWDFGQTDPDRLRLVQTLVAAFGAVALFRTKLFSAAQGEESVSWGPSRLLEMLLDISDRALDRRQATVRGAQIPTIMAGVSFAKAFNVLPLYVMGLLERVDKDEQARVGGDVAALAKDRTMDDAAKALGLGAAIIRVTGPDLLRQAVLGLGDSILARPAAGRHKEATGR